MDFNTLKEIVIRNVLGVEADFKELSGAAKKKKVIERVTHFVRKNTNVPWFLGFALNPFLDGLISRLVDKAVRLLNYLTNWNLDDRKCTQIDITNLACSLDLPVDELVKVCTDEDLYNLNRQIDAAASISADCRQLSPNLTRNEVTCQCGCGFDDVTPELVQTFQALRDYLGRAVHVSSGNRCVQHNTRVGGSARSEHMSGNALDIFVNGLSKRQLFALIKEAHAEGLLPYLEYCEGISSSPRAVHIDTGRVRNRIWGSV